MNKEITNQDIIKEIGKLRTELSSEIIKTQIDLSQLRTDISQGFGTVMEHIVDLRDITNNLKDDVTDLKLGQNRIELRLEHVAHRYEFQDHEQRIKVLERKTGIVQTSIHD